MTKYFSKLREKDKKINKRSKRRLRNRFFRKKVKASLNNLENNDTQKKVDEGPLIKLNIDLIKKNIKEYSFELVNRHFEIYSKSFLANILSQDNVNKKPITEEILKKYNLIKEDRKVAIRYLYNFIRCHNINIKCYFSSIYMFDLFLINYSEDDSNQEKCQSFFKSKITNDISEIRIVLLLLCCFYIVAKFFNTKLITINQLLLLENAKYEYTFDEINDLINDIIMYTEANICDINLYIFIEFYLFDIRKRMKQISINDAFIEQFETSAIHFSTRIIQDISVQSVSDSIKALAIILFSFEFTKHSLEESNAQLNDCFKKWRENLTHSLINYDINGVLQVIQWLNSYMAK
jgi:hypothetical protein